MTEGRSLMNTRQWQCRISLLGLGIAVMGCGSGLPAAPPLAAVEGTITMDKQVLPGVVVMFMPDAGRSSVGLTDKNGVYTLEFDAANKGAVPGKHKVKIMKSMEADLASAAAKKGPPQPIPSRYNNQTTLETDVKAGEKNKINFDLTSK